MNRRLALRNLGVLTWGMVLFPACDFKEEKVADALPGPNLDDGQAQSLHAVVAAILPEGELPGGKTLKIDEFVWLMVKDFHSEKEQAVFINGLEALELEAEKQFKKPFTELTFAGQEEMLNRLYSAGDQQRDLHEFLNMTKNYSVLGFMNSEYIMTKEMPYTLVPGRFGLCETIDVSKQININA
ncbi:MAG: gluconate 2-dehydrogenase subunit 3 family protein [Flavobacteriaceae bacterium]|nr:gluconate 2-dehydrogenase subunit 3 family protein [Flavobacteriaceae bacterium]